MVINGCDAQTDSLLAGARLGIELTRDFGLVTRYDVEWGGGFNAQTATFGLRYSF